MPLLRPSLLAACALVAVAGCSENTESSPPPTRLEETPPLPTVVQLLTSNKGWRLVTLTVNGISRLDNPFGSPFEVDIVDPHYVNDQWFGVAAVMTSGQNPGTSGTWTLFDTTANAQLMMQIEEWPNMWTIQSVTTDTLKMISIAASNNDSNVIVLVGVPTP